MRFVNCFRAQAGCAVPNNPATPPAIPFVSPRGDEPGNRQEGEDWNKHASIVGLWHVIYTGTSDTPGPIPVPPAPPSFQYVETFKTWHADGTEFENAIVPPAGGICYGVWKDIGHGSVKLHHIGLMFDSHGDLAFIFTVDERYGFRPRQRLHRHLRFQALASQLRCRRHWKTHTGDLRNNGRHPHHRRLTNSQPDETNPVHCAEGDRSSIPFVTHACSTRARGTCGSTRSTRDGLDRKRAAGFTAEAGKTYSSGPRRRNNRIRANR